MVAEDKYQGRVEADTIEVRFAYSGKVIRVVKGRGERVKKGEILAVLDRALGQKELETKLANYEKVRAEFEIFAKHHPNPGDDLTLYAKKIEQAQLDESVKEVEMAKMRLDQADLVCPVNGTVVDDGGNRVGLYVTPASNAYQILDSDSMRFTVDLEGNEAVDWTQEWEVKVNVAGREIAGKSRLPYPTGKQYAVEIILAETAGLLVGMTGEVISGDGEARDCYPDRG